MTGSTEERGTSSLTEFHLGIFVFGEEVGKYANLIMSRMRRVLI